MLLFNISGSEFVEMLLGERASRVRQPFDPVKKTSLGTIFIDEIDAAAARLGLRPAGLSTLRDRDNLPILAGTCAMAPTWHLR